MSAWNFTIKTACIVVSTFLIGGCGSAGNSISLGAYRAVAWHTGDDNIHISILDAIDQALSMKINGDDLHSHQISLRRRLGQTYFEQATQGEVRLCSEDDGIAGWINATCRSHQITDWNDPSCMLKERCVKIQLAPFIASNPEYIEVARKATENPCSHIPDYETLRKRHRIQEPRGGQTPHLAVTSEYWLYCDTGAPITGNLKESQTKDVVFVHWTR